jgi:NTP pyrophosphatase (non-canonical NTP hydrolase)
MTFDEYQKLAARTISKELGEEEICDHAMFGMVAEMGELFGLLQKSYQGHALDQEHLKKELGDLLWFIAEYCTSFGWSFGEIAQMNIDKLKARYPDGFDPEKSLHRAEGDI